MLKLECLDTKNGHLTIGGCDTIALAKEYGTPLYVLDEQSIRKNIRLFKDSLAKNYENSLVIYASKALNCLELCRIAQEEGIGVDIVSGGELFTALKAGVNPSNIFFHGNNKTTDELEMAVDNEVGRIIVDNIFELEDLNEIAKQKGKIAKIMLRIKPGVDAHTHEFIRTGQIDSKFGFALENGEAIKGVEQAISFDNINLTGLHCHIGSQIFSDAPFIEAARVMIEFYKQVTETFNVEFSDLNLGGGFGIKYTNEDTPLKYDTYMNKAAGIIKTLCSELSVQLPRILIEPGRSIVGEAGITLYKVGAVKEIKNVRNYVSIDGGMTDNPRYALYGADYTVVVANKMNEKADYVATIAGKCCESGDLIQENTMIVKPEKGDILAVLSTGAYNYSMASNYNRIPRPAMVMVNEGEARLIIKRESYEDIIKNDL